MTQLNITVSNLSDWKALAFGKSYSALLLARAILKFKLLKDLDVNTKSGFLLTESNYKPFHVVGMIYSDVILGYYYHILGQQSVMIIDKPTSYWSKTGFFSVCQLKK